MEKLLAKQYVIFKWILVQIGLKQLYGNQIQTQCSSENVNIQVFILWMLEFCGFVPLFFS